MSTKVRSAGARFDLGSVRISPGASHLLDGHALGIAAQLLARHQSGDWGELGVDDRRVNEEAVGHHNAIRSSFMVNGEQVWIVTEADRSLTTILTPVEYADPHRQLNQDWTMTPATRER